MKHNLTHLVHTVAQQLKAVYPTPEEQRQVALWLLEKATNKTVLALQTQEAVELNSEQLEQLNTWVTEHVTHHKPLQYILGSVPFLGLTLTVRPPTLIPRPETEEWVYDLVQLLQTLHHKKLNILDIGTGSGCIALALGHALPEATVVAADIAPEARALSQENAENNGVNNVTVVAADVYTGLPEQITFDLIVSNPPYITPDEYATLEPSVALWEDKRALTADDAGLAIIKKIIVQAHTHLRPNTEMEQRALPQVMIEIGYTQATSVVQLIRQAGFTHCSVLKDLAGKERVVTGRVG
jgi:release factor-specific protein-(glutamine-N5) methyltransferase